MHPLTVTVAATTLAILVNAGVVGLVLGLTDVAVDADVIHLHIAVAAIVEEFHHAATGEIGGGGVILHVGGESPGLNCGVVYPQTNLLLACSPSGAHHNGFTAATSRAAAATAIVGALAHGDIRGTRALIPESFQKV